jgi:YVTN family beta-propeller protein
VGDDPRGIAITPDGQMAYVLNQGSGTVTPIDIATHTAGAPIPVGGYLEGIVITPDSKTAYVLNGSSVTPIDTATDTAGKLIPVGPDADAIAITPDGKTIYVTNWTPGTVTPIATATNTPETPILVGSNPNAIAITPDGKAAYAENWTSGTVTPIDTATNASGQPIAVGSGPDYLAITPNGKTLYVAAINSGTVTPINTATNTAGPFLPVGWDPYDIAITPDSATAYVAVGGGSAIEPIATVTGAVGPPIAGGGFNMAVTPDGKTLYVPGGVGITPIATATDTPGAPIPIAGGANAIAFTPVPGLHAPAFTSRSASTAAFGAPYSFTVTATGSPAPSIGRTGRMPAGLRFTDNHDGTATISGTPSHGAGGTYQLTLIASNKAGTTAQAFTLTVTRAPTIRKTQPVRARIGIPLHRTIHAKGYPIPTLTETGALPAGLSFSDNTNGTATISGTPAAGSCGRYPITVTATNSSGTATQQTAVLVLEPRAPCRVSARAFPYRGQQE